MPPVPIVAKEDSSNKDGSEIDIDEYIQEALGEETLDKFAGLVDDNSTFNTAIWESRGRDTKLREPVSQRYESMVSILRSDGETYKLLAEEIEKVGGDFFRYFHGETVNITGRYISDVFLYRGKRFLNATLERLREYGGSRRNGMFGFSVEDDHIHIIHDCTYSGGSCRCAFKDKIRPFGQFGPDRRYNKHLYKFTRTDWYDVFTYFFLAKRGTREIWFNGKSWEAPNDSELVRWEEIHSTRREMVRCEDSGSNSECSGQSNKRSRRAIDSSSDNEIYGKKAKSNGLYANIKQKTKTLLLKYYPSPISAIRDTMEFRNDDLLSDPKKKDYVQAAFDDFGKDLNVMTLREIETMLQHAEPIFIKSMCYGNMEESLVWIDDLLNYQFNEIEEDILHFLNSLVDVLDRKVTKLNSISVLSPPSAGKNFFFDMILALCLNYGQLGQANRHNVFAFQEAPNKRVLIWNEPNYDSSLTDTIKMMFAGDPYTVRVKHLMDQHVSRTPVIILSNTQVPFMVDNAFKDRLIQFRWKEAPQLRDIVLKPYPMSFFALLKKYNIEYYNLFL
jgi:hypothetical protein